MRVVNIVTGEHGRVVSIDDSPYAEDVMARVELDSGDVVRFSANVLTPEDPNARVGQYNTGDVAAWLRERFASQRL